MAKPDKTTDNFDSEIFEPMAYNPRRAVDYETPASPDDEPVTSTAPGTPPPTPANPAPTTSPITPPPSTHSNPPTPPPPSTDAVAASSFFNAVTGRRASIFFGVILILIAAYLLIVSISYYFHGAADQSIVTNGSAIERVVSGRPNEAGNIGHFLGAWISEILLSQWLGIGSFVIIFYIAAVGLSLVRVKAYKFWNLTLRCLLSAITVSVVFGLISVATAGYAETHIYLGGFHGHELNRIIINFAGWIGAISLSVFLIASLILLFYNDLRAAYAVYRRRMDVVKQHRAERRAEMQRRHELEQQRLEEERRRLAEEQAARDRERAARQQERERQRLASIEADRLAAQTTTDAFEIPEEPEEPEEPQPVPQPVPQEPATPSTPASPIKPTSPDPDDDPFDTDDEDDDVAFTVTQGEVEQAEEINRDPDEYDPTAELSQYRFPPLELLIERETNANNVDAEEQEENKLRITQTLNHYNIAISSIKATVGPTVTLYEIVPAEGVRISKIKTLEDDIALSLAALGIRIIAPIPGKGTIGIEVPNKDPQTVSMRSIIGSKTFQECRYDLPMALGRTISNDVFIADLAKIPHLLVAGATGMGKSVGLNAMIASLLYKKHPSQLKFVMIDPKMVEFSLYSKIENHYLAKLPDEEDAIITDVHKAIATLNSLCVEMENRYTLLKDANQRNIKDYNERFVQRRLNPADGHRYLPYIVVVVDEFADLIMQVGREIETPIARIAQKARAVGIHMILATQRPSTNVITGVIKANFPGRVAFRVFQMVDSRTILDRPGANQLIGRGDMLFSTGGRMERVQCAFIDTPEVEALCDAIEEQVGYPSAYELPEYVPEDTDGGERASANTGERDPLFDEIARLVATSSQASTSSIQRRYNVGYNRAGRIMDQLEAAGIVGPAQGGKPRQVLVDAMQVERILGTPSDFD